MRAKHVHREIDWSAEDRARHEAIRNAFRGKKPKLTELLSAGEWSKPVELEEYLALKQVLVGLKQARERAGLSLEQLAKRSGMDKASLSRLENGRQTNPTLSTLWRYARGIGKQLTVILRNLPANGARRDGASRRSAQPRANRRVR